MLVSEYLERLVRREIKRLIVEFPPRHGKSELISHWFPISYLETFPREHVILASYEADFAANWGRKCRNSIQENQDKLRLRLKKDTTAVNRWETMEGGGMVTAGVGGPITGRGADCLIIDDPVKNAEEAYSLTRRERIWDWWRSTAFSRLEPNGIVIIIMTRWHKDDLAGRLLKEIESGEGEKWEIIKLPALAEKGDLLGRPEGVPLWPDRFGDSALKKIRVAIGSVFWASLYQQDPTDKEGGLFQRKWFTEIDRLPNLNGNTAIQILGSCFY